MLGYGTHVEPTTRHAHMLCASQVSDKTHPDWVAVLDSGSTPMKIFVCSRRAIEHSGPFTVPHLFISIRTPGDPNEAKLPVNDLTRGVLRMEFHDLDRVPERPIPLIGVPADSWVARNAPTPETLFNPERAVQVLDFVRPHVDQKRALRASGLGHTAVRAIIVHCDAGWSRSPAVAAALTKTLLGQDDTHWFKAKSPNMLVYRTLLTVYYDSTSGVLHAPRVAAATSTRRP